MIQLESLTIDEALRLECVRICNGDLIEAREAYAFVTDKGAKQRIREAMDRLREAVDAS